MGQCLVKTRRSAQASQLAEPFFSPPSPLPPPSSFSPFPLPSPLPSLPPLLVQHLAQSCCLWD